MWNRKCELTEDDHHAGLPLPWPVQALTPGLMPTLNIRVPLLVWWYVPKRLPVLMEVCNVEAK